MLGSRVGNRPSNASTSPGELPITASSIADSSCLGSPIGVGETAFPRTGGAGMGRGVGTLASNFEALDLGPPNSKNRPSRCYFDRAQVLRGILKQRRLTTPLPAGPGRRPRSTDGAQRAATQSRFGDSANTERRERRWDGPPGSPEVAQSMSRRMCRTLATRPDRGSRPR